MSPYDATPTSRATYPIDWSLIWIIFIITGILFLQTVSVLTLLYLLVLRRETYWRRLRERGEVILDGPVLIWTRDLPPKPTISTFNLRRNL